MQGPGIKRLLVFLLSGLLLSLGLFGAEDEYYRKAALFKIFGQYIRWPESSGMSDLEKPFVIAVIGKNPFGSILELAFHRKKEKIKGKNVDVRYISKTEEIPGCHILFICPSMQKHLEEILAVTRGKPILTIGETRGFAEKGVLFNLYADGDELRFEINAAALVQSGLIASSQLLSVARIINMPGGKK